MLWKLHVGMESLKFEATGVFAAMTYMIWITTVLNSIVEVAEALLK